MDISAFRHHLRAADDPRVAGISEHDAYSFVDRVMTRPAARQLFDGWQRAYRDGQFHGITTEGQCVPGLFRLSAEGAPVQAALAAATRLLALVTPEQSLRLCHSANAREWHAWMNPEVYLFRFGLRLEEVDQMLRDAILQVLQSCLSEPGFARVRQLMRINHFLGELVNAPRVMNEYSYNFNLFGTPSATEPWGWNFYGHHVCINCRLLGSQMVATPVFFGAEPNGIDTGPLAGLRVFDDEESLGLALMRSLPAELQQRAQLYRHKRDAAMPAGRVAIGDELTLCGAFQDNRVVPYEGACAADFAPEHRQRLLDLVGVYLAYLPEGPRQARLADVQRHLKQTWFCWIGGVDDTSPFYYRIQSPVLIVEFDHHAGVFLGNTEPERFHIHTLVRTPNGNDYGMDVVRQHCECAQRARWRTDGESGASSDLGPVPSSGGARDGRS
jgi:hypothetical protein